RRRGSFDTAPDHGRNIASHLLRSRSYARNGLSIPAFRNAGIADREDLWIIRNGEILEHLDAPGSVSGNIEPGRRWGCRNTRRPQDATRGYPFAHHDTVGVAVRNSLARPDLHSEPLQGLLGGSRHLLGKAGQESGPGLDQNNPSVGRIDMAKIVNQGGLRELGDGASEFHARRAGADDHKIEQSTALARLLRNLRCLEGGEHNMAN